MMFVACVHEREWLHFSLHKNNDCVYRRSGDLLMKKMLLLVALALFAVPAHAADRFGELDKNSDGQIVWEEFQAGIPGMKQAAFEQIDADKSGGISRAEWEAFRSGHGMSGMGAGMKMPPDSGNAAMPMIRPPSQSGQPGAMSPSTN